MYLYTNNLVCFVIVYTSHYHYIAKLANKTAFFTLSLSFFLFYCFLGF